MGTSSVSCCCVVEGGRAGLSSTSSTGQVPAEAVRVSESWWGGKQRGHRLGGYLQTRLRVHFSLHSG